MFYMRRNRFLKHVPLQWTSDNVVQVLWIVLNCHKVTDHDSKFWRLIWLEIFQGCGWSVAYSRDWTWPDTDQWNVTGQESVGAELKRIENQEPRPLWKSMHLRPSRTPRSTLWLFGPWGPELHVLCSSDHFAASLPDWETVATNQASAITLRNKRMQSYERPTYI